MSFESELRDDLPDGWSICESKSKPGTKFYFNLKNGQSVWATPNITKKILLEMEKQFNKGNKLLNPMEKGVKRKSDCALKYSEDDDNLNQIVKKPQTPVSITNNASVKSNVAPEKKDLIKNFASKRLALLRAQIQADTRDPKQAEQSKPNETVKNNPKHSASDNYNNNKTSKAEIKKSLNNILDKIAKPQGVSKNTTAKSKKKRRNKKKKKIPLDLQAIDTHSTSGLNNTFTNKNNELNLISTESKDVSAVVLTPKNEINIDPKPEPKTVPVNPNATAQSRIIRTEPKNLRCNPYAKQNSKELKFNKVKSNEHNLEPKNINIDSPAIYSTPKSSKTNETILLNEGDLQKATPSSGIKIYSSANNRLAAFRTQLSKTLSNNSSVEDMVISGTVANDNDSVISNSSSNINDSGINIYDSTVDCNREEDINMDVDIPVQTEPVAAVTNKTESDSKLVLVVDTNLFIHDFSGLNKVLNSKIKGYKELPTLMVPWRVLNELDGLKDNNRYGNVSTMARRAMDFLYKSLPENNRIQGQTLRDAHTHIYPCEIADDEILNCCFQQANLGHSVILLSNDKNLCTKAVVNGVRSSSLKDLLSGAGVSDNVPNILEDTLHRYQQYLYDLLANIMENEMRIKFNNVWQHLLYKVPPWTLNDVVCSILKNWYAVFSEVFPIKKMESVLKGLKSLLSSIENKGSKKVKNIEVDNFKNLAIEIATNCQIIPEYMNLAKLTLEKLNSKEHCHSVNVVVDNANVVVDNDNVVVDNANVAVDNAIVVIDNTSALVIEAFERIWNVFSSYCARLSEYLGIRHNVDIKVNLEESCSNIKENEQIYCKLIQQLTLALKGILDVQSDDPSCQQQIASLESVFNMSLASVNTDCRLDDKMLKTFCANNRNMLQEAYSKFSQLSSLLVLCGMLTTTRELHS